MNINATDGRIFLGVKESWMGINNSALFEKWTLIDFKRECRRWIHLSANRSNEIRKWNAPTNMKIGKMRRCLVTCPTKTKPRLHCRTFLLAKQITTTTSKGSRTMISKSIWWFPSVSFMLLLIFFYSSITFPFSLPPPNFINVKELIEKAAKSSSIEPKDYLKPKNLQRFVQNIKIFERSPGLLGTLDSVENAKEDTVKSILQKKDLHILSSSMLRPS